MPLTHDKIIAGYRAPQVVGKNAFTAEAAGLYHNLAAVPGSLSAWTLGAPGLNGAAIVGNALGGAVNLTSPTAPTLQWLGRWDINYGANIAAVEGWDFLWYNSGLVVTTTTAQAITPVDLPSRCPPTSLDDTAAPDALGTTIEAALFVATATTNAGAITNTTMSYTNSDGVAGRTGTIGSFPATAVAGTIVPFALQAGDRGVRSVQSVTLGTSYVAGAIRLMLFRRVAFAGGYVGPFSSKNDYVACGRPRVYNDSAIYPVAFMSGTAGGIVGGAVQITHADPT